MWYNNNVELRQLLNSITSTMSDQLKPRSQEPLSSTITLTLEDVIGGEKNIAPLIQLFVTAREGTFARECKKRFIDPHLEELEKRTGSKFDALFLAYMVQRWLSK